MPPELAPLSKGFYREASSLDRNYVSLEIKLQGTLVMKHSSLSKFALMSAFTISLVTLPITLSASAQTGTPSSPGNTTDTTTNQRTDSERDDDGFDWGLLGLLGLAGLAGLRKREESVAYRDSVEPSVRPR